MDFSYLLVLNFVKFSKELLRFSSVLLYSFYTLATVIRKYTWESVFFLVYLGPNIYLEQNNSCSVLMVYKIQKRVN